MWYRVWKVEGYMYFWDQGFDQNTCMVKNGKMQNILTGNGI